MDFIYLLRVLLKRKWIIIGATLLAAGLAYFFTLDESKKYLSSAQISTGYAIKEIISINPDFDPYAAETKFNTTIVQFVSDPVLSLLSYKLILHDLDSTTPFRVLTDAQKKSDAYRQINISEAKKVFKNKFDSMTMLTSYKPEERKLLEFLHLYGYDLKSIAKNLNVYRLQRTDFVQIDKLSENPELSAFIVNNLFTEFLRYTTTINRVATTESIDTLKSVMERKKLDVDFKNALLSKYGIVEEGITVSAATNAGDLRTEMQNEKSKRNQKAAELRRVNQKLFNLSSGVKENPQVNNDELMQAQEAAANARIAWTNDPNDKTKEETYKRLNTLYLNLRKQASTSVPEVKIGDSKEDLLDKKADLESEIQGYDASIGSFQSQINQLEADVSTLSSRGQTVETLKRERDQANKEYLDAKTKYNNAIDIGGSSTTNFRQTVYGQPAIEPEPSKRLMMIAMAGGAAFVTTLLIIIFLTYLDTSIKTPVIFSKNVNLKLISLVNFMDLKNKNLIDIVANKNQQESIIDRSKFNAFRESIRKLRYEVESTGKKVFLFTSTKKGQGKTTLIQALAYSMSLSKKKILIIDTNFCNPDLTAQLHADPILEKIIPYKANGTTLVDQVKKFSKEIGAGTVYAIGSEGGDYTPSEILPRENLLHHLQALTAEFDYIFLEGPPLNDFSDSKELAQYVDGVIAVFSATHIIKQIDKQSISFFRELNGKFCGSILNMVDLKNVNVT
ncbi:MAG: GumC family protein [Flavisolibacter sp.]